MYLSDGKVFHRVTSQTGNTWDFDTYTEAYEFVFRQPQNLLYNIERIEITFAVLQSEWTKGGLNASKTTAIEAKIS